MAVTGENSWTEIGSTIAGMMFVVAIIQQYLPFDLRGLLDDCIEKILAYFNPYMHIKFQEYSGDRFKRNEAYSVIGTYLSATSSDCAHRLKGDIPKNSHSVVLSMDDREEVPDVFQGVTVWWASHKTVQYNQTISFYPGASGERRYYKLSFHRRHRKMVTGEYLKHVLTQGNAISMEKRTRKLFTNNPSEFWESYKKGAWSHVPFEHPATFDTLAMEPKAKEEIVNDLMNFSKSKEYYKKIGRAWKRGYLLYGPPGTGKSSMIAAMANLLSYDVYDLELTAVEDNTELRRLLIETTSRSIIVIEDIDCSLDLTGQRKSSKDEEDEDEDDEKDEKKSPIKKVEKQSQNSKDKSKVTLSGLLNFVDGLWSACGGERIIIFTTNFIDKLDPALIRRGRMDRHIEMSYCGFEAFKVLARNYLDAESHELFPAIEALLGEVKMTPADVAESLMPKCGDEDVTTCLENLVAELETAKEEYKKQRAEEEEKRENEAKEEAASSAAPTVTGEEENVTPSA